MLPVAALLALLAWGWFALLDANPLAGAASALVVIPTLVAGTVLTLGVLAVPSGWKPQNTLSRQEAPALWALWDEVDPPKGRRRILAVDSGLNASMADIRGPLGLRRHEVLTLGLPLLMMLDEPAIRAVVSHEAGHARLDHAAGTTNIIDFIGVFDFLFFYAAPYDTIVGALAHAALEGGLRRTERARRDLSRQNEFEADAFSADKSASARALVLVGAAGRVLARRIFQPVEREVLGAMSPPMSPIRRMEAQLNSLLGETTSQALVEPEPALDDESAADLARYGATHPPLEERLAKLGYSSPPDVAPVSRPASSDLLSPEMLAALIATFDRSWRTAFERMIDR